MNIVLIFSDILFILLAFKSLNWLNFLCFFVCIFLFLSEFGLFGEDASEPAVEYECLTEGPLHFQFLADDVSNEVEDHSHYKERNGESFEPLELVEEGHLEADEQAEGHHVCKSEEVVQVFRNPLINSELIGILNFEDLFNLFSSSSVQVIINLSPVLNHKKLKIIKSQLKPSRVGIMLRLIQLIDVLSQSVLIIL